MRCYHCDQPLTSGDRFCPHCGAPSGPPQLAVCPTCRGTVPAGSAFCPACGASLRAAAPGGPLPVGAAGPSVAGGIPGWGKIAAGGLGGLMLGSLLGGHHGGLGGFGGWGGDRDDGGGFDGGD